MMPQRLRRLCAPLALVMALALLLPLTSCIRYVGRSPEPGSAGFAPENVFDEICICFAASVYSNGDGTFSADDIEGLQVERRESSWTGAMECSGQYSAYFPSSTVFVGTSVIEFDYGKHVDTSGTGFPHLEMDFEAELTDGTKVKVYVGYSPMSEKKSMGVNVYDITSSKRRLDTVTSDQVLDALKVTFLSDYFNSRSDSLFALENLGYITLSGSTGRTDIVDNTEPTN